MSNLSSITAKISALKTEIVNNSITPLRLGSILLEMLDAVSPILSYKDQLIDIVHKIENGGSLLSESDRSLLRQFARDWRRYLETSGVDYSESLVTLGRIYSGPDDDLETIDVDIREATHDTAGVMSAEDKRKLDSIVSSPETVSALTVNEVVILTDINP